MSLLAKRYARAAFEAASEKGAVDAVAADLAKVDAALRDAAVRQMMLDPETKRDARRQALDKVMGQAHETSRSLVEVVLRRRREAILSDLSGAFMDLVRQQRGEVEGVVESAKPMADDQLRVLESSVSEVFGKRVTLRASVHPELIGGVRVRVENTLYDGSVATILDDLERRLMEALPSRRPAIRTKANTPRNHPWISKQSEVTERPQEGDRGLFQGDLQASPTSAPSCRSVTASPASTASTSA